MSTISMPPLVELMLMSGITYREYAKDDENNIRELK